MAGGGGGAGATDACTCTTYDKQQAKKHARGHVAEDSEISSGPDDLITLILSGLRVLRAFFQKVLHKDSRREIAILSDCIHSTSRPAPQ